MLVTGLGPHSECTAKLGFKSALLPHHQAHSPGHKRRRILWPLGPHWSFSKDEEGRFGRLPPPHPLAYQHNIKANREVNKFTKRNRTFKKEN